mgnify:CR=1 FL=1
MWTCNKRRPHNFFYQIKNIFNQIINSSSFPCFEKGEPSSKLFHSPTKTGAAIVDLGGRCPDLNNLIKGLVNVLESNFGVYNVYGIRYVYKGLVTNSVNIAIPLNKKIVEEIHKAGGSILWTLRGNQDHVDIVNELIFLDVNNLYAIGGDGTLRSANVISDEIKKIVLPIGVVGIPKTIDNDLVYV